MGYYDGVGGISTKASAYDLADTTDTPVILVVNSRGMSISLADNNHMSCLSVSEIPAPADPLHFWQVQGSCQSPVYLPIFRPASANVPSDQKSPQEAQDPDDGISDKERQDIWILSATEAAYRSGKG